MSTRSRAVKRQVRRGLFKTALLVVYAVLGLSVGVFVGRVLLAGGEMGADPIAATLSGALVGTLVGVIVGGLFAFSRRGGAAVRRSRRALIAGLVALVVFAVGARLFVGDRGDEEASQPAIERPVTPGED